MEPSSNQCLNEETALNIIYFNNIMKNPMGVFGNVANVKEDFNMFAHLAQIFENLSRCRFEESAFDILNKCTKEPDTCEGSLIAKNL